MHAEKCNYWSKFWPVFQNFACGAENVAKTLGKFGNFLVHWESSENQFSLPKKGRQNLQKNYTLIGLIQRTVKLIRIFIL